MLEKIKHGSKVLAILTILCALLCNGAFAASIQPRSNCTNCGGSMTSRFENVKTHTIIGSCKDNPSSRHYLAYRCKVIYCSACGMIETESVVATGKYCTCNCGDCDTWEWD